MQGLGGPYLVFTELVSGTQEPKTQKATGFPKPQILEPRVLHGVNC